MRALRQIFWIATLLGVLVLFLGQEANANNIKWSDPLDPQVSVAFTGQNFTIAALLDTGANFSVIDKKLADEMNVKRSAKKVEIYFPAEGETIDLFRAEPFEVTISAREVPLIISPIIFDTSLLETSEIDNFAHLVSEYPFILGMEDLFKTDFFINYPDQAVGFQPLNLPFQNTKGGVISIEFEVLIGDEIINCVVDTGAPDIPGVFIQAGHPRYEALRGKFDFFYERDEGFSTSGKARATHDPKARVGTLSGEGLLIEFEIHDSAKELGRQCWLGGEVLQNVKMRRAGKGASFKSETDGIYSEGSLPPVRYNRLGFSHVDYNTETKFFVLKELVPHGGLSLVGAKDGDILHSMNGVSAEIDNVEKLRDIARGRAGEKVTVVIRSPSETGDELSPERSYEIMLTDVLANQP